MILRTTIGVFSNNQATVEAIESLREDRLLFRCTIDVHQTDIKGARGVLAERRTPGLLIVETSAQGEQLFSELESLAEVCDPETRLILIGTQNDIELYRTLIQYGVGDYLVAPVNAEVIRDSIGNLFGNIEAEVDGRIIAFYGLTGGAGSSVLAHNTAHALATLYEERTAVIDMDLYYGTAALNFNMQPRQTIVDAMTQITSSPNEMLDPYFIPFEDNIIVMPSPASLTSGIGFNPDTFDALIRRVKPVGEFVILDLPTAWNQWISDAIAAVDDLVLVVKPDLTSLRNAKSLVEYLGPKRGSDAPTRLVINQVGGAKRSDLSEKEFKDALAMTPSASIPYDPEAFGRALNNGEMLAKAAGKSKANDGIVDLAKVVGGREAGQESGKAKGFSLFKKDKPDKPAKKKKGK